MHTCVHSPKPEKPLLHVLNYKCVSSPLFWIGLLTYLNLSICLSAVLRNENLEITLKPVRLLPLPMVRPGADPTLNEVLSMRKPLKCARHLQLKLYLRESNLSWLISTRSCWICDIERLLSIFMYHLRGKNKQPSQDWGLWGMWKRENLKKNEAMHHI